MVRYLAENNNYKVTSEYEYVTLHFKNNNLKKPVYIGDFYGDPDCAIISCDEKYLVVGGCGLILYKLKEPFSEYNPFGDSDQYIEFFRGPKNIWWITKLHQSGNSIDGNFFRFEAANDEGVFIYEMNVDDFSIKKMT